MFFVYVSSAMHPFTGCSRGQTRRWKTGLGIAAARRSESSQTQRRRLSTGPPTKESTCSRSLTVRHNGPVADQHSGTNTTYWQVVWTLHSFTHQNTNSWRGDTRKIHKRADSSSDDQWNLTPIISRFTAGFSMACHQTTSRQVVVNY